MLIKQSDTGSSDFSVSTLHYKLDSIHTIKSHYKTLSLFCVGEPLGDDELLQACSLLLLIAIVA